jgi:protein-tyrosine phosphatase
MARFCVRDGITHVVATPHCHRFTHLLRSDILPHVTRLNEELTRSRIPLTILPGSEIQLTDSAEYRRDFEAGLYCHLGDGHAFTLLEFPWKEELYPADAPELISWLRTQGMTPIIAHPERHRFFELPERLRGLVEAGAWLQVTADSLLGNHGTAPQSFGENLLRPTPKSFWRLMPITCGAARDYRPDTVGSNSDWVRSELTFCGPMLSGFYQR